MVENPHKRVRQDDLISNTVHTGPLPDKSLCDMGDGVFVESPELAYSHLSRHLSLVERQMLAMELCGTYSTLGTGAANGFKQRDPLLTVNRLIAFLNKAHAPAYAVAATSPLQHLADRSASPMESAIELLLCEPYRRGGYGFPTPAMNARIDIPHDIELWGGKQFYVCDFLWKEARLAIEYDSNEFHSSSESLNRDAIRRNIIEHLGYRVLTLTANQVRNTIPLQGVARQIAKALGKRLRLPDGFQAANTTLMRSLRQDMPWQR